MSDASAKAAELLARRPHFRRQLEHKLARRGFAAAEIEATLDRLTELGYLDDRATAVEYVRQRLARAPEGRSRLAAELGRRGAAPEAIEGALAEIGDDDERLAARRAAEAWRRSHRRGEPAALARHLGRKGFAAGTVHALVVDLERHLRAAPGEEEAAAEEVETADEDGEIELGVLPAE